MKLMLENNILNNEHFLQCKQRIETILKDYQAVIQKDYQAYLNHCIRMAGCCLSLQSNASLEDVQKIAIAAAFHDIGIWTARTMDYLEPSVREMENYLNYHQLEDWREELRVMITEHHKLTPVSNIYPLAEYFRRADYADFSLGLIRLGVSKKTLKLLMQYFPNQGFHLMLLRLGLKHMLQKPWSPLPMFKW